MELEWKDPPLKARGAPRNSAYDEIVAALRERPGQWAQVLDSVPHREVNATHTGLHGRGCQVAQRKVGVDKFSLWARWPEPKVET